MKLEFSENEVQRAVAIMIAKDFGVVVEPSEIEIRTDYGHSAAKWEGEYVGKAPSTGPETDKSEANGLSEIEAEEEALLRQGSAEVRNVPRFDPTDD